MSPLRATQRAREHKRTSLTRRRAHAAAGPTPVFETGREGEIGVPEQGPLEGLYSVACSSYIFLFFGNGGLAMVLRNIARREF